jgi:hypothetical protein
MKMIKRNAGHARRQETQQIAQREATTPAAKARVGSTPAHTQQVGTNDPETGEMVMYGILGVTPASEPFRLKD